MDVDEEQELYMNEPLDDLNVTENSLTNDTNRFEYFGQTPTGTVGSAVSDFIWDGVDGTPGVIELNGISPAYDDSIYVHIDHPSIGNGAFLPGWTAMAQTATLQDGENYSNLQTGYRYDKAIGYQRSMKMSFSDNDQYLLGGKSCGAYLFLSPSRIGNLEVDGDNKFGKKTIGKVDTKQVNSQSAKSPSITLDIVFQYRMTDQFGVTATGGVDTSNGRLGGLQTNQINNLTYSKTIGIDLFDSKENQFSFDLQVFSKYKPQGYNLNNTKTVRLQKILQ